MCVCVSVCVCLCVCVYPGSAVFFADQNPIFLSYKFCFFFFADHNPIFRCEVPRKSQRIEKEETPSPAAEGHQAREPSSSSKPQSAMHQARWNFVSWTFQQKLGGLTFLFLFLVHLFWTCTLTKNAQVRKFTAEHKGKHEWAHKAWMMSKERAAFVAARKGTQL